jgi:hypothetical protein
MVYKGIGMFIKFFLCHSRKPNPPIGGGVASDSAESYLGPIHQMIQLNHHWAHAWPIEHNRHRARAWPGIQKYELCKQIKLEQL